MKEEKYIQSLFETARQEDPRLSFEEASKNLEASLSPRVPTSLKDWFFNHIYLNSFLIVLTALVLSITVFTDFQTQDTQSTVSAQPKGKPEINTPIIQPIEIDENQKSSTAKTVEENTPSKIDIKETKIKKAYSPAPTIEETIVKPEARVSSSIKKNIEAPANIPVKEKATRLITSSEKVNKKTKSVEQTIRKSVKKDARSELEIILETALNSVDLRNDLFVRNTKNEFNQLVLLTNDKFDDLIKIHFSGKRVIILRSLSSGSFNMINDEFVNVEHFKFDGEKAFLDFVYNSVKVQVELEKNDDIWTCNNTIKDDHQQNNLLKEELLQMTFDDKRMNTVIGLDSEGIFKSFALLANDQLSNKIAINYKGDDINIVPNLGSINYNKRTTYMKIIRLQIKRKKATFVFSYLSKTTEIVYRKKGEEWSIHSFKYLQ